MYKKKLSFLASFIIGEQYGEESINQSLGIKTEDSIIDQLKNFVEILRDQARLTKGFDVNADKMRKLMRSIENGLLFDEIKQFGPKTSFKGGKNGQVECIG